mgnify:FL=1
MVGLGTMRVSTRARKVTRAGRTVRAGGDRALEVVHLVLRKAVALREDHDLLQERALGRAWRAGREQDRLEVRDRRGRVRREVRREQMGYDGFEILLLLVHQLLLVRLDEQEGTNASEGSALAPCDRFRSPVGHLSAPEDPQRDGKSETTISHLRLGLGLSLSMLSIGLSLPLPRHLHRLRVILTSSSSRIRLAGHPLLYESRRDLGTSRLGCALPDEFLKVRKLRRR